MPGTVFRRVPEDVTSGTGWHWDTRGFVAVDGDGAVFEGYSVQTEVSVTGNNAIIRNNKIYDKTGVAGNSDFGVAIRHAHDVTVANNEIYGNLDATRLMVGVKTIYGDEYGTKVLGNNIYGVSTGVQIYNGLIEGNYIHDMGYAAGDHINGITDNGGDTRLLTIRHNTVFNQIDQTDAISLFQDFGPQSNRVVDDNLLAGGGWTVYAGGNAGKPPATNIKLTNNKFSTRFFPNCGSYGPIAAWSSGAAGNEASGNVWIDGPNAGATINP